MGRKNLRIFVFIFFATVFVNRTNSQTVSHTPQNKNFLIERGTGHVCGSCPHITLRCDSVMHQYPGRCMMIEYHFGPDAVPQGGGLQTDYRTKYGDSILSWPFYLNMMINRRDQGPPYGSTFIFGTNNNQIQKEADIVVTQPSEVNLAMNSSFNPTTRLLTVNVEAYYTANSATALNFIQVAITEDSLISMQYDGDYIPNNHFNPNFNHTNVFRANLNGFWGDSVKTTVAGTTISRTYTFTLPTTPYKWNANHCNLTMYVAESKAATGKQSFAGKIITAVRSPIGGSVVSGIEDKISAINVNIYPNPSYGVFRVTNSFAGTYSIAVMDVLGNNVYESKDIKETEASINISPQSKGLYFLKITTAKGAAITKMLLVN